MAARPGLRTIRLFRGEPRLALLCQCGDRRPQAVKTFGRLEKDFCYLVQPFSGSQWQSQWHILEWALRPCGTSARRELR